ncbi:MAG: septum formation protein Maf [Candidatus Omnitrophica bacterium]|nr:septum formation protein Maf [Candidatus Omnitrophota bacterium]
MPPKTRGENLKQRAIILASRSPRRASLLRAIGLKFKIVPSNFKEKARPGRSCASLVKYNALMKAQQVAHRFKSGVIIGADTVVLCKGRLIGKPKDFPDALRILKTLTRHPHWVYTGLAIIDLDRNKTICAYEKTRSFMRRLSEKEIKGYLERVHSLDKAGACNIEDLGGTLVRRIEGDFYNVVGLPLARLAQLLKTVGIDVLAS